MWLNGNAPKFIVVADEKFNSSASCEPIVPPPIEVTEASFGKEIVVINEVYVSPKVTFSAAVNAGNW